MKSCVPAAVALVLLSSAAAGSAQPAEAQAGLLEALEQQRPRSRPSGDPAAVRAAYWGALSLLAAGRPSAAVRGLLTLEASVLRDEPGTALGLLAETEGEVARRLAEARPESLLAVAALHRAAGAAYDVHERPILERHALAAAASAAEAYAAASGTSGARQDAATVLARLAVQAAGAARPVTAGQLLQRALALDATNAAALLAQGMLKEGQGSYHDAAVFFRYLVGSHPECSEGRLRLAVNLRRTGHPEEAAALLETCAADGQPSWVRAVAFDELVRLAVDAGDWPRADALLDRAERCRPEDPGIRTLRAYVAERSGRPLEALELVQAIVAGRPAPSSGEAHPRLRYTLWPHEPMAPGTALPLFDPAPLVAAIAATRAPDPGS